MINIKTVSKIGYVENIMLTTRELGYPNPFYLKDKKLVVVEIGPNCLDDNFDNNFKNLLDALVEEDFFYFGFDVYTNNVKESPLYNTHNYTGWTLYNKYIYATKNIFTIKDLIEDLDKNNLNKFYHFVNENITDLFKIYYNRTVFKCEKFFVNGKDKELTDKLNHLLTNLGVCHQHHDLPLKNPNEQKTTSIKVPDNLQHGDIFKHFKGNYYRYLNTVRDSETEKDMIIYETLYIKDGLFRRKYVRPADMFFETVIRDGYNGPRFKRDIVGKDAEVLNYIINSLINTHCNKFTAKYIDIDAIIKDIFEIFAKLKSGVVETEAEIEEPLNKDSVISVVREDKGICVIKAYSEIGNDDKILERLKVNDVILIQSFNSLMHTFDTPDDKIRITYSFINGPSEYKFDLIAKQEYIEEFLSKAYNGAEDTVGRIKSLLEMTYKLIGEEPYPGIMYSFVRAQYLYENYERDIPECYKNFLEKLK